MKLTKHMLREMIEEEMDEPIDTNGPDWQAGLSKGGKTARRLVAKGEVQTEKGIRKYIAKASGHRNASYQAGYKLGFELHMSKTLGKPIPDGQQHYANARSAPPPGFFGFKEDKKK